MSDKNDTCPRCNNQPYYDGHLAWCDAIRELELRFEEHIAVKPEDTIITDIVSGEKRPLVLGAVVATTKAVRDDHHGEEYIELKVTGDAIGYLLWALEIARDMAEEGKTEGLLNWTKTTLRELEKR